MYAQSLDFTKPEAALFDVTIPPSRPGVYEVRLHHYTNVSVWYAYHDGKHWHMPEKNVRAAYGNKQGPACIHIARWAELY